MRGTILLDRLFKQGFAFAQVPCGELSTVGRRNYRFGADAEEFALSSQRKFSIVCLYGDSAGINTIRREMIYYLFDEEGCCCG